MIRLFVAIDIPEDIRALTCGMGGSIPGAKPVPDDQFHLTIKFIGEVESSRLLDIRQALSSVSLPPFAICLRRAGHFPPRRAPKVLWLGIAPIDRLTALRNSIEQTLSEIGIAREKRKFAPHVTLARLKNSPLTRVADFLAANSMFETPAFTIREFQLYSSTLSPKGAVHTRQASYPLADDG